MNMLHLPSVSSIQIETGYGTKPGSSAILLGEIGSATRMASRVVSTICD